MSESVVLQSIRRRVIREVYHFIGLPWLPNVIHRGGVWCARQLRQWGDDFDDDPQKWGTCEKGQALSGYISCSVNPPMGMMKKSKRPVLLALDPSVAATDGVVFIGKWSSFGDVLPEQCLTQTGADWFDRMFLHPLASRADPHPGEFLVPSHIPLLELRRIVFFSDEDLEEARASVLGISLPRGMNRIPAAVTPALFGRTMQEEGDEQ